MHLFGNFTLVPVLLLALSWSPLFADAFAPFVGSPPVRSLGVRPLDLFGGKTALEIEKKKNPAQFEQTIKGLMQQKKLNREQAETRYADFLNDPDGFALRAMDEDVKAKGYRDWRERAIGESADPGATQERIDGFINFNRNRGTAIILAFFAAAIYYSETHPFVPGVK